MRLVALVAAGLGAVLAACAASAPEPSPVPTSLEAATRLREADAERFAGLALACIHRPYPNQIAHVLAEDADAQPPASLTPAFFGCYDWHSAVHGHWLLVRLARRFPGRALDSRARAALDRSFTAANLRAEYDYVGREDRRGFERPYGLAWVLALAAELRGWSDPQAEVWAERLAPLEQLAAARLRSWLRQLSHPIRSGEHSQTAFALGLAIDWARGVGDQEAARDFEAQTRRLYAEDRSCPLSYEPSGHDFLSPCLAEADLMRRVLDPAAFARWLSAFLPSIPDDGSALVSPVSPPDRADGKLAHLDGLNLSRAWMLHGIAAALPPSDPRRASLGRTAAEHAAAGLAAVTGEHYAGGHWLATFATYLTTQ